MNEVRDDDVRDGVDVPLTGDACCSESSTTTNTASVSNTPVASGVRPSKVVDALAKWNAETNVGRLTQPLNIVKFGPNEQLVIPFTTSLVPVALHYVNFAALQGYVHCNGPECLLCRIGRQVDMRDLLPVLDPIAKAVTVLPVSPNLRPQALRPLLMPVLREVQEGHRKVLAIRKLDMTRYSVDVLPLRPDTYDGAREINEFIARFEKEEIDLASVFPQVANAELTAIPEIKSVMELKGIRL